jgi:syntaxin 6
MSLEDPFFVVKDEVMKALTKTRGLYDRWRSGEEGREFRTAEEQEWAATELKNSLRSIEWDLEDLEDTVQIVEKNPTKFRIDGAELAVRKGFIENTRDEVGQMKEKISRPSSSKNDRLSVQSLTVGQPSGGGGGGLTKYSRLSSETDSPHKEFIIGMEQQEQIIRQQDETLEIMTDSMGNIRSMSQHVSNELDEQAVMLDEFGAEIEHADSKLDATMKKMAKVLHLSDDRRQWMAIGALSSAMVVVLVLIFMV